jgi:hypothetical protein
VKAVCAYCLREIRVRNDGRLERHDRPLRRDDLYAQRCLGSGRPPKTSKGAAR